MEVEIKIRIVGGYDEAKATIKMLEKNTPIKVRMGYDDNGYYIYWGI